MSSPGAQPGLGPRGNAGNPRLRRAAAEALVARWWGLVAVATQDSLAATLLGDAPHLLHGHPPELPLPLGDLLLDAGEAPAQSRLPLR